MTQAVLLENGLVIDGTGAAAQTGDVLLVGERIAAVGLGLRHRLPAGLSLADVDARD
jgi:N-acyl-D-amino-acid deacylase